LKEWLDAELDGYRRPDELPDYRIVGAPLYGDFSGAFWSGVRNVLLSTTGLPPETREIVEKFRFCPGVGQLQELVAGDSDALYHHWDFTLVELLRVVSGTRVNGMILNSATSIIPLTRVPE